jgi:hypothetical protein
VGDGRRSSGNWMEKKLATARVCARGDREGARGPEEAVPVLKQVLAPRRRAWQPWRSSGRSSATWRPHEQASTGSGGRRHGRRVTRGTSEGRRWRGRCCDGERRRSAARAGGGRRGEARGSQCEGGKRRGRDRGDTCMGAEGCWSGRGGAHGRAVAAACGRGEAEEREREVDEGGPVCNFRELQGPYCNISITFKPVLEWRWAQKQKCMVFQNVQLCFKVHPYKS